MFRVLPQPCSPSQWLSDMMINVETSLSFSSPGIETGQWTVSQVAGQLTVQEGSNTVTTHNHRVNFCLALGKLNRVAALKHDLLCCYWEFPLSDQQLRWLPTWRNTSFSSVCQRGNILFFMIFRYFLNLIFMVKEREKDCLFFKSCLV